MAQHEPNMVPTWPKMSQHSPKWPKISPIWSQLLPNKANTNHKIPLKWLNMSPIWCQRWPNIPENIGKNEADGAKTAPSCSANQHGKRRKAFKYIKISRVSDYHGSADNNTCRCKTYSNIRSDKSRYQHHESYTKLFSEFLKLEKGSRSERHPQNMTIHYPNISVKPVKQCHNT